MSSTVNLIKGSVTTVDYSVLLNGEVLPSFKPGRGLRQGDPLSPYLFVLVCEVFSFLLHEAIRNRNLSGICISIASFGSTSGVGIYFLQMTVCCLGLLI